MSLNEHIITKTASRIIIYHGVCLKNPTKYNALFVSLKTFEAHLQYYKQHFNIISLDDFYKQNFSTNKFTIALTFDDGFANNYKYVLPLLEQYEIPATFFVTAIKNEGYDILWNHFLPLVSHSAPRKIKFGNDVYKKGFSKKYVSITTNKSLSEVLRNDVWEAKKQMMELLQPYATFKQKKQLVDYWLQMTVEEIRQLSTSKMATIGSHGYYHNDLTRISLTQLTNELQNSKNFIENITQKPVNAIAFPYGSYSKHVIDTSINTGYTKLLATDFINEADKNNHLLQQRMGINPYIAVNKQIEAICKGSYAK